MNRSFEILKDIYKPIRLTIRGKVTILETMSGTIVVKEKENSMKDVYQYLSSRNFYAFPKLIENSRDGVHVFEYVTDTKLP